MPRRSIPANLGRVAGRSSAPYPRAFGPMGLTVANDCLQCR